METNDLGKSTNMKSRSFLLILGLLLTCCNQGAKEKKEQGFLEADRQHKDTLVLINDLGDTIPVGVPIPTQGKAIDPDSYPPPKFVPFPETPKEVPAKTIVHPAKVLRVTPERTHLRVTTPGNNGIPLPKTYPAEVKVVPAQHPKRINALSSGSLDTSNFNVQHMSQDQGLPTSYVTKVLEDSKGRLWIGAGAGLFSYDGTHIHHYTLEEGLAVTGVSSILEDAQKNLWLGHLGGITRFDGHTFTHYSIQDRPKLYLRSLQIDKNGNFWLLSEFGLLYFDGDQFTQFTIQEGLNGEDFHNLIEDRFGNLWIGTKIGIIRFDPPSGEDPRDHGSFTHYTAKDGLWGEKEYPYTKGILEDREGNLWFGTIGKVIKYTPDNSDDSRGGTFTHLTTKDNFRDQRVNEIFQDRQGTLWFGTNAELLSFDGSNFWHYANSDGVHSILEDRAGNIWCAAEDGMIRVKRESFVQYTTRDGLIHDNVTSIVEENKHNFWFGTNGGFVCRYRPSPNIIESGEYTHFSPPERGFRWGNFLYKDSNEKIWIGGNNDVGVCRLEGNGFTVFPKQEGLPAFGAMLEDNQGYLWFGSWYSGLIRLAPSREDMGNKERFTQFTMEHGLRSNFIDPLIEDKQGRLWLNPDAGGVSYFEPNKSDPAYGGTFTHIIPNERLKNSTVLSVLEDSQSFFWFGTNGDGLIRYDGQGVEYLTAKEGLSSDFILSIVEDKEKNIWLGTGKGLTVLVPNTDKSPSADRSLKEAYRCITFGKKDGLKSMEFNYNSVCYDSLDRIWWGTMNGVTRLDLKHFQIPLDPPKNVGLAHIEINQNFVNYNNLSDPANSDTPSLRRKLRQSFGSIPAFYNYPLNPKLPHDLNHLTFHFTAIDWEAPHQIRYRYRIKKLDKDWSSVQAEAKADYRNLPYGRLTLQVQAIGIAQLWSEPFEYTFTILPPWWLSWWAKLLYGLFIISALYALYQFLLNQQLARAEAYRLKELDEVKNRLYTNITHEFRTPLTVILGMVQRIKVQPTNWMEEGLNMIQRNGQNLLRLVNQMLDLSKLESGKLDLNMVQGDIIQYLGYVMESFQSYAAIKDIRLHFHSEEEELLMDYDPDNLLNVVSNLLSNAIKFTEKGGDVYVEVGSRQLAVESTPGFLSGANRKLPTTYCLLITVRDTGVGISADRLPFIFDRFYQVDDSSTRKGEGTGIGLALTRELVKLMEGEIAVESTVPGKRLSAGSGL